MFWERISSLQFWLSINPPPISTRTMAVLAAIFAACFIAGMAARTFGQRLKKKDRFMSAFWKRVGSAALWAGGVGWVLTFCSYQGIPLFGMRLWYLVWLLGFGGLGVKLALYRFKKLPEILSANHQAAMKA